VSKLRDVLNTIHGKIVKYELSLNNEDLSLTERLLIQIIIDLNYLRWESVGEWIEKDDD